MAEVDTRAREMCEEAWLREQDVVGRRDFWGAFK